MIYRLDDKRKFDRATKCWICNEPFTEQDNKVRDHCHYTGKFRGAAHNVCNLKYKGRLLRLCFSIISVNFSKYKKIK